MRPVAAFVRVGQRRAPNRFAEPHVIKLRGLGRQAGFDVSETFPIGQLGKRHDPEIFGTAQRLDVTIAAIPLDNPRKCRPRQKIHQLGEQRLARIHWPLRECLPGKVEQEAPPRSNRHRPCSLHKPAPAAGFDDSASLFTRTLVELNIEQRAMLWLASTHAVTSARTAAELTLSARGSASAYVSCVLEKCE